MARLERERATRLERERATRLERERIARLERERSDAAAAAAATAATVVSEIAIALHDFTPSTSMSTDDATRKISIQRGQRLRVIKHGQNGWTQGVCESTGEKGWFPTSYVRVESNNGGLTAGQLAADERASCPMDAADACTDCLQKYCRVEMTEGTPVSWEGIRCFCGCGTTMEDATVQGLFAATKELRDEFLELERKLRHRRISSNPHYRFCPNPRCSMQQVGTISAATEESKKEESKKGESKKEESKKEESKKEEMTNLLVDDVAVINTQGASSSSRCWRCSEEICIRCGASAHDSDCAAAHAATLDSLTDSEGWVRCTKCRHLIHRVDGCDHMTCRCGAEFCFQCGAMPHCGTTCKKKKKSQQQASAGGTPPAAMGGFDVAAPAAGGGFGAAAPGTEGRAPAPAAGGGFTFTAPAAGGGFSAAALGGLYQGSSDEDDI